MASDFTLIFDIHRQNNFSNTTGAFSSLGARLIVLCIVARNTDLLVAFPVPSDSLGNVYTLALLSPANPMQFNIGTPLGPPTFGNAFSIAWYYCVNPNVGTAHNIGFNASYPPPQRTNMSFFVAGFSGSPGSTTDLSTFTDYNFAPILNPATMGGGSLTALNKGELFISALSAISPLFTQSMLEPGWSPFPGTSNTGASFGNFPGLTPYWWQQSPTQQINVTPTWSLTYNTQGQGVIGSVIGFTRIFSPSGWKLKEC